MFYLAPFGVTEVDFGTITLATAGKTSVTVTISALTGTSADGTSGTFFHYPTGTVSAAVTSEDVAATTRLNDISQYGFGGILQTALRAGATTNSWTAPSGITVQWRKTVSPYSYRIAYPSAVFSVTWSNSAGRALMGFQATQTGGTSYDGTAVPTYCINPTLLAASDPSMNVEPASIANHILSDDGSGSGTSRYVSPLYRDWIQQYETKAKTSRLHASALHPETFQGLFEKCRTSPFMVIDGFGEDYYECFSLRSEGIPWAPERAARGSDTAFHIKFMTVVEGSISGVL